GILEIHHSNKEKLMTAGRAVLQGIGLDEVNQLRPRILYSDVIEDVIDSHAVIVNRNRQASMIMPGETLLVCEMVPALYAAIAANEAEKLAPGLTLVDVQMIGAAGRVYMSGKTSDVETALAGMEQVLASIEGREA